MGNVLNRASSCIRTGTALAAAAIAVAGCAAANNATSASSQGEEPYRTAYGISSEGPTTDLYTELFRSRQPPPAPATNVAAVQPVQPVTAQPVTPAPLNTAPQSTAVTTRQTTTANRVPQPVNAQPAPVQPPPPVQVVQQPAPPPPEPDVPTAYGITASGPTTDLYTEIFGPRRQ